LKALLDELVVPRDKTKSGILLREVIPLAIFLVGGFPFGLLFWCGEIFGRRVI
jgi:hypothetical protein